MKRKRYSKYYKKQTCKYCGKEFIKYLPPNVQKIGGGKFCSYSCNSKAKRKTSNYKEYTCMGCGKKFIRYKHREKYGRNMVCSKKCINKGLKRPPMTKEHKEKLRQSSPRYWLGKKRVSMMGKKNYHWKGGISKLPYPFNFNKELKELVRKRDNYRCQICGCSQMECLRKLDIHHKDYDKNNLNPKNLVPLCRFCHGKTTSNRKYWIELFESLMEQKYAKNK